MHGDLQEAYSYTCRYEFNEPVKGSLELPYLRHGLLRKGQLYGLFAMLRQLT